MARSPRGAGDSDDWFADVEPQGMLESDPPSAEDDWLVPLEQTRGSVELPWQRIAIVAVALIVILVAGLAAGGVFSSSNKPRALDTNPALSVTTPTTTAAKQHTAAALPIATSKPGDSGAQVRALQRALKSLGYSVGTVDGQYGPSTKTAVAAFQHTAGLTEDGVFGPKTLDALITRAGP